MLPGNIRAGNGKYGVQSARTATGDNMFLLPLFCSLIRADCCRAGSGVFQNGELFRFPLIHAGVADPDRPGRGPGG